MAKFPKDAPKRKVVKALEALGFRKVREKEHISMIRENTDGTNTPLRKIKGSTLRSMCSQAGITREDFLAAYKNS